MRNLFLLISIMLSSVSGAAGWQAQPLVVNGKKTFLLGNWDTRRDRAPRSANPLLVKAGMNCFMIGVNMSDPVKFEADLADLAWFAKNHPELSAIVDLDLKFILKSIGPKLFVPVPDSELAARREFFRQALGRLAKSGNVIGYSIDELENRLYGTLDEWKKTSGKKAVPSPDLALTYYMEAAISWVTADIKKYHPDACFMPVQAWWTTYAESDKLFDVLIANQYPVHGRLQPGSDIYSVAYDAECAAAAVRKLGKKCFIYCPPGFDQLDSNWKNTRYTLEDMRYMWQMPLTYGAQGVIGWRQRRASEKFTREVIIPVMSEISAMTPWLLGEAIDDKVKCRNTGSTTFKVPKRSRLTEDDAKETEFHIRKVRTFSYIVRRNPVDKSVLLLIANNSSRAEKTEFQLDKNLPSYGVELIGGTTHTIREKLKVNMEPFSVRAYLLIDQTLSR